MIGEVKIESKGYTVWNSAQIVFTPHTISISRLEQGYVDVMVTRDEDTYTAKTKYNLRPVAYEVPYTQTESKASSVVPIFKGESFAHEVPYTQTESKASSVVPFFKGESFAHEVPYICKRNPKHHQ